MLINDRVYGKSKIDSPVLIELIRSKTIQRLKRIGQFGVPNEFYHLKNFSRYEHSVGVMILLKKLGATEEEQVAGLLHDASHTAFSHLIDWVLSSSRTEDAQDRQHKKYINSSDTKHILIKYRYDPNKISEYNIFGLLERSIPDLCADRIDYSLREMPINITSKCLKDLTTYNGKIVFKHKTHALLFAKEFLSIQMNHWGGFEASARFRLFADVLRQAIKKKIIKLSDFWRDDKFVTDKLKKLDHPKTTRVLKTLRNKSLSYLPKSTQVIHKKFRHVDPLYLKNGRAVRLSQTDGKFKEELRHASKFNQEGIVVPLIE